MVEKHFINALEYQRDCIRLAKSVYESGFSPNWLIALWRGGTTPGMTVQEYLKYKGITTDHIAVRSSSYDGIEKTSDKIRIHGLDYFIDKINSEDRLIIVDDVFDKGKTMKVLIEEIYEKARKNTPTIKIATVFYKPENNLTKLTPDFYIHKTDKWLIFPHELDGLSEEELKMKTDIADIL